MESITPSTILDGDKDVKNKPSEEGIMVLKINLFTNIPEGDHTLQNKEFKRSMIVLDKELKNNINKSDANSSFDTTANLSQYPFISSKYKFKPSIIYKNYEFIYRFFFSYNTFIKMLESYAKFSTEKSEDIIYHNIDVLLRALFPLFLKTSEGYYNSYKYIYEGNGLSEKQFSFNNIVETLKRTFNISSQKYTILNIGKDYTVKKIVWLNDFISNPNYNNLVTSYIKFKIWMNDYAKSDIVNYNLIMTRTFATNRADFEKKKLKLGNRNYADADTNNPFFMKEIKDSSGKLNENYLNYAQFYDVIQYYNDNKTINDKLQKVIDGVFYLNKPPDILKFEKFMNEFLSKIKELDLEVNEYEKEMEKIYKKYDTIGDIIGNMTKSIKSGVTPKITLSEHIRTITGIKPTLIKIIVKIRQIISNMQTILNNYSGKNAEIFKNEFEEIKEETTERIDDIGIIIDSIINFNDSYLTTITFYQGELDSKIHSKEKINEDYLNNYHRKLKKANDANTKYLETNKGNMEILQSRIKNYIRDNTIIDLFNSYSISAGSEYNEQEKVENFYNVMDEIIKNKSNINKIDDSFKKIIAFKTQKSIEQNKKYLPMIRIDVMMDFIDGKINNENYSQLQCPYMSNDLSNLVLNKFYYKNDLEDYSFLKNSNYIYSITDNGIKRVNSRSKDRPDIKKNEYKNDRYDNKNTLNNNSWYGGNRNRKTRHKKLNKKRKTKKNI